jgi:hypothetical protein
MNDQKNNFLLIGNIKQLNPTAPLRLAFFILMFGAPFKVCCSPEGMASPKVVLIKKIINNYRLGFLPAGRQVSVLHSCYGQQLNHNVVRLLLRLNKILWSKL